MDSLSAYETSESARLSPALAYALSLAACVGTTLLATPLLGVVDLANIVMLFLLAVVLVAVTLGREQAVAASFFSVALFDFFFVPPRFSLAVTDAQYLITFAVMFAVALIIGQLTARLRFEARETARRERQTKALYAVARELSGVLEIEQVQAIVDRFARDFLGAAVSLLLPDQAGQLQPVGGAEAKNFSAAHVAAVYRSGEPTMFVADAHGYAPAMILPLSTPMGVRGVMVIATQEVAQVLPENRQPLLEAMASLAALVVERLHYVEVAQQALLGIESERLRSSLLSAVSHDLRTPLTILVGLADSLVLSRPPLAAMQAETAGLIRDQALHMSSLAHNLLDMARLQSGSIRLRKEWQPLEEIVGSSLAILEQRLAGCRVTTRLPDDLPLLAFDAVLMERVLFNLLDNAIKYAPGGEIAIEARLAAGQVEISVCDNGPGLAPGMENAAFELFERGRQEGATSGAGLGLAICRAIVEAHGGRIQAGNQPSGGACFTFTLPLGTPPALDNPPVGLAENAS